MHVQQEGKSSDEQGLCDGLSRMSQCFSRSKLLFLPSTNI